MHEILEKKYRRIRKELITSVSLLGGVFLLGTLGYWSMEGWSLSEAAYMTAITLSTVGFTEVRPLGPAGRLFTMSLIALGVITIGYIVNRFTEAIIAGYFQDVIKLRQQKRLIDTLSQHYILCGFGRTGRQVALEFKAENIPFLVIENDPEEVQAAEQLDCIAVLADATLDSTLIQVGIERAICLITVLPSDAENLYTLISAKTLNPKLRVIARANTEDAVKKLQRAGADTVISPYITGGRRMAAAALRPEVMDFVDGIITGADRTLYLEEYKVNPETCPFAGSTIKDADLRGQTGALILAIRRQDGTLIGGPTADTKLLAGDVLICMGTPEQLRRLNQILSPLRSQADLRRPKQLPPNR